MKQLQRCFVALDLPPAIIQTLEKLQEEIVLRGVSGKLTTPENLHLTVKFLGEIDDHTLSEVTKQLQTICMQPFVVSLGKIGVFSRDSGTIIWVELCGAEKLQQAVDHALRNLFATEQRFMGHITLMRTKTPLKRIQLQALHSDFLVDRFILKKSTVLSSGPLYDSLEEYILKKTIL